ncbi:hypothetical protein FQR65_LT20990 [Abscondita terminalis]|nr:hypothetical protein FQR65_LT20990 [Abscondita terminalis]
MTARPPERSHADHDQGREGRSPDRCAAGCAAAPRRESFVRRGRHDIFPGRAASDVCATRRQSRRRARPSPRRLYAADSGPKTPPRVPDNDLECLTQAIYYEARNESEAGQAAVAEVVLNRVTAAPVSSPSPATDRSATRGHAVACARAERIAREVYEGRSASQLPRNSVNYHANYVRPSWGQRLARVRQIGAHIFYGAPLNGGSTPGAYEPPQAPTAQPLFVRNEALDRAYAMLTTQVAQAVSSDAEREQGHDGGRHSSANPASRRRQGVVFEGLAAL